MRDARDIIAALDGLSQLFRVLAPPQRAPLPQEPLEYKWIQKGRDSLRARERNGGKTVPLDTEPNTHAVTFVTAYASWKVRLNLANQASTPAEQARILAEAEPYAKAWAAAAPQCTAYDVQAVVAVRGAIHGPKPTEFMTAHEQAIELANAKQRQKEPQTMKENQPTRQATDLEKAEVIASDLAAFRDHGGLPLTDSIIDARQEAAAIFCRAADTIDEAAHHVRGAKGTYDERTDYALNVVAKRPEVIEAHTVVTTLAPHLNTHDLHRHLARTDPENGHRRGDAAESALAPYAGAEPDTPHHDRIARFKKAVDSGREELKTRYGVREPANAIDVARAGTEAQDFAEREVYTAEAGLQLSAAAADARSIEQEAQNLMRHRLCKDLEGHTSGQEMADTLKQLHAVEVEHGKAAEKNHTRTQLQALADKCDPVDFAPSAYDPNDLASMEYEFDELHSTGLTADEVHERDGKQELAKLVDAAERNQHQNKQAQNIAAQRGHGHGFSR